MKTRLAILGVIAAIFSSCTTDKTTDIQPANPTGGIRIYTTQDTSDTRVSFEEDGSVVHASWELGDVISVHSKTQPQKGIRYKVASITNGVVEFKPVNEDEIFQGEEGDEVFACYPATNNVSDDYYVNINLTPESPLYTYAKSSVGSGSIKLQFHAATAFIKLTLSKDILPEGYDTYIECIKFSTDYRHRLSGDYGFNIYSEEIDLEGVIHSYFEIKYDLAEGDWVGYVPIMPLKAGTPISLNIEYPYVKTLISNIVPESGFEAGHIYTLNTSKSTIIRRAELQREALVALYRATNGDNWNNNENWLSDKPLSEWYGVEGSSYNVIQLNLYNNNLVGVLPEEFVRIFDCAMEIDLSDNHLYGTIPEKLRKHSRWDVFGFNIIKQSPWLEYHDGGKRLDMSNINLRLNDAEIEYINGEKTTWYELLSKHKLVHIMIAPPSDERINQHLSYHNKGFTTIITHNRWGGGTRYDEIPEMDEYPREDMVRLWEPFDNNEGLESGLRTLGSTFLVDSEGNVVDYYCRDWDIPEEWYNKMIDEILLARLGEPEDHPIYETPAETYYESTDYSRDGEVVTFQKATTGKGIDLVFMGDAYVDRDMDADGKYEQDMREGMEYFFSIEPYKSFRDRFNVYAVKVISKHEHIGDGCEQRLNYNDGICFEYAAKIPGIEIDKVTVVNAVNNPDLWRVSGYTNLYDSNASVAHIERGGVSSIIIHESGGHGFAKLLDEYVVGGCEDDYCPEDVKQWVYDYYHSREWGMNLDTTNDPEKVIWSKFLTDPRYSGETGIYEGAWRWGYGVYRPSENSVMNTDYSRFNAPSREAIYKAIMRASEGDSWQYDFEEFAKYDEINRNAVDTRSYVLQSSQNREIEHRPPTIINKTVKEFMNEKH